MEEDMSDFKILTGKPTGNIPSGSSRRRCKDNIRVNLKERGINPRNWVDSGQHMDCLENSCECYMELRVSYSI